MRWRAGLARRDGEEKQYIPNFVAGVYGKKDRKGRFARCVTAVSEIDGIGDSFGERSGESSGMLATTFRIERPAVRPCTGVSLAHASPHRGRAGAWGHGQDPKKGRPLFRLSSHWSVVWLMVVGAARRRGIFAPPWGVLDAVSQLTLRKSEPGSCGKAFSPYICARTHRRVVREDTGIRWRSVRGSEPGLGAYTN